MSDKTTPPNKRDQAIEKVLDYSARVDADISEHDTGWFYQWSAACEKLRNMEHERSGPCPNAACEAIEFALSVACEEPISFLRCWNEGDFDSIRDEWPEAPGGVFTGAEPKLWSAPSRQQAVGRIERAGCKIVKVNLIPRDGAVRLSDSHTGKARIVRSEDECQDDTELSAYQECIKLNGVITMGSTIAEPVR